MSQKKTKAPVGANQVMQEGTQQLPHPLLRKRSYLEPFDHVNESTMAAVAIEQSSMNPTSLITGYYGARGEKIRHVVHEGALRLPPEALEIIVNDHSEAIDNSDNPVTSDRVANTKKKSLGSQKGNVYQLPALDSITRPSLNLNNLGSIKVTILSGESIPCDGSSTTPRIKCVAKNVIVQNTERLSDMVQQADIEPIRIRGGGEENHNDEGEKALSDKTTIGSDSLSFSATTNQQVMSQPIENAPNTDVQMINQDESLRPDSSNPTQEGQGIEPSLTGTHLDHLPSSETILGSTGESFKDNEHNKGKYSGTVDEKSTSAGKILNRMEAIEVIASNVPPANHSNGHPNIESIASFDHTSMQEGVAGNGHSTLSQVGNTIHPVSKPIESPSPSVTPSSNTTTPSTQHLPYQRSQTDSSATSGKVILVNVPHNDANVGTPMKVEPVSQASEQSQAVSLESIPQGVIPEITKSVPNAAVSESLSASSATKTKEYKVIALKKRPAASLEQQQSSLNNMFTNWKFPVWFQIDFPSNLELSLLPEWFDNSAPHRTESTYIDARNKIISMSQKLGPNRFITAAMARRSIPGDAGSIIRLHNFLTSYAIINEDALNDTAPTPFSLRNEAPEIKPPNKIDPWSVGKLSKLLLETVVQETVRKRPRLDDKNNPIIDWGAVANSIGNGVLPSECERHFLSLSIESIYDDDINSERPITPDYTNNTRASGNEKRKSDTGDDERMLFFKAAIQSELVEDVVENSDPAVLSAVTDAALGVMMTQNKVEGISSVQKAGILGLVVSQAVAKAKSEEAAVSRLLAEIVELRMQKLENRLSLLDDVEGMLDAERVCLELERRDLYTARCRHWFGGT